VKSDKEKKIPEKTRQVLRRSKTKRRIYLTRLKSNARTSACSVGSVSVFIRAHVVRANRLGLDAVVRADETVRRTRYHDTDETTIVHIQWLQHRNSGIPGEPSGNSYLGLGISTAFIPSTGALLRAWGSGGYHARKTWRLCAKSCNLVHRWPENGSQCRP